jgi:uncharacterized protein YbjT (DUF2867 family)
VKIAVAGGTGITGRHVTESVRAAGHTAVVLSRSAGVDLMDGRGLADALRGVSAVIDVTNTMTARRSRAVAFFGTVTTNLLEAERQAGVGHHVAVSIIGTDRIDYGYYLGKRRQEELVLAGPVPGTVLRTAQFHEFAGQLLDRVAGPVALAPLMLCQPVAAAEAAEALVQLALAGPAGLAPELAGPQEHLMPDLVRRVARARGSRRPVLALRLPGAVGKAMAGGGQLPSGPGPRGVLTFDGWLAAGGATGPVPVGAGPAGAGPASAGRAGP